MSECISLKGELLRRLQQTQLSILKDVAEFCDKNDIKYCLSSGTLLGAVRHGGFIPWDDDIDISMPRKDFEKFLSIAQNLPEIYQIQATRLQPNYPIPIVKVRLKGTIMKEPDMAGLDICHGVWIDVFPLDKVKNVKALSVKAHFIHLLTTAILYKLKVSKPIKLTTKAACRVISLFGVKTIDKWRTALMSIDENTDATLYTSFASNLGYRNLLFSEAVYFPLERKMFEGYEFSVPSDYDKWLTAAYGDYMQLPPKEKQVNRHKICEIKL